MRRHSPVRIPVMRFGLRTMFVLIAAIAILLAQYPYVRFHFTRPPMMVGSLGGGAVDGHLPARGYYVPTARFAAVAGVETAIAIVWLLHVRRRSIRDQKFAAASS